MPAPRVIGVDLGGTKLLAGAVDPELSVHHRLQRIVAGLDQQALLDVAQRAVVEAIDAAGAPIEAVGFGIPALIDRATGTAAVGVNTNLHEIAFADVMSQRLGLPVFVDNDGNCTALAEHRAGACRGAGEAIVLTLGTGIAGGLILGGELYRGARGGAGELGHMVIELDGPPCHGNCPSRGCAEVYVSGTALVEEARRLGAIRPGSGLERALADNGTLAGPLVTELAHAGDAAAIEAITLIGSRLGVVLGNLINIFDPQVIVIGGGVIAAGELLLAPARAVVAERVLPFLASDVRIVAARFGEEAGMVGAAALAYDELARTAVASGIGEERR
ncbi:MAG TPA: ROK family protein [Solirubrobacteraceae bacterium]|jgi:glucokinase|nr:ROK family protein [Solirubrobacteraceae bacterium]